MTQLVTEGAQSTPVREDGIVMARDLVKRYGDFTAVNSISFSVKSGECFGLLGPNGAGKTTTIKMINCVSPVTEGILTVDGMDVQDHPREVKSILGVVPQEDNLDPDLSVRQNLRAYARYFDMPKDVAEKRIDEALHLFQLFERQNDRLDVLSGGMKRRLTIARGLLNQPRILVLDEPTTGLDPQARHLVWQKLRGLRAQGVTMLLTTHYMDEAAHLCDRIVIIDRGKIIEEGTPDGLIENSIEAVDFFRKYLLPIGAPLLAAALRRPVPRAERDLLEHIRICYDTSHMAVEYEEAESALDVLQRAGIQIGKVQISAALKMAVPSDPEPLKALVDGPQALRLEELPHFLEDVQIAREAYEKRRRLAKPQ